MLKRIKEEIKKVHLLYHIALCGVALLRGFSGAIKRRRGAKDHLLDTVSLIFKSSHVIGLPINVTIEPTTVCNLRCPVCETGTHQNIFLFNGIQ